jgi:hypothetical protein
LRAFSSEKIACSMPAVMPASVFSTKLGFAGLGGRTAAADSMLTYSV